MQIIHLSDLHFGTEDNDVTKALLQAITNLQPDLVVISGDFTQIASWEEFQNAQRFLHSLDTEFFCVPGNHDIPTYNILERFFEPYKKYKTYIQKDLCPTFENEHLLLCGLNSARRALPHWNWANGSISQKQRERLKNLFGPDQGRWRICTFHHPIHKVDDLPLDVTVFGRKRTLQTIQDLKIDLVLTGHVHHASITTRGNKEHQTIYLSASTALSSRLRGQENGFNVIDLYSDYIEIEIFKRIKADFESVQSYKMKKSS